jgi:hypothetical protein
MTSQEDKTISMWLGWKAVIQTHDFTSLFHHELEGIPGRQNNFNAAMLESKTLTHAQPRQPSCNN